MKILRLARNLLTLALIAGSFSDTAYAYSFWLDSFSLSGDEEEFDTPLAGSGWDKMFPTISESQPYGEVNFSSPGAILDLALPGATLEQELSFISDGSGRFDVDGLGNFTASTVWTSGLPETNEAFMMQLFQPNGIPGLGSVFAFGLANASQDLAAVLNAPIGVSAFILGNGKFLFEPILDPGAFAGNIVLTLDYNSGSDSVSGSVSSGGSETTLGVADIGVVNGSWGLGGLSLKAVPSPATLGLVMLGLLGIFARRKSFTRGKPSDKGVARYPALRWKSCG
jgi:hypothetical protein